MPELGWIGWNGPTLVLVGVLGTFLTSLALWRRRAPLLVRIVLFALVSAAVSAAYFGYVQRRVGLGDDLLGNPVELLEEAKRVKRQTRQRNREIRRTLRALEDQREPRRRGVPHDEQEAQ